MASSYVFRKINGELWQQARGACITDGIKLLDVVEHALREWLQQRTVDAVTAAQTATKEKKR